MPVVGEAHIIVRAITTNVAKDIKNGFNGVSGVGGKNAEQAGQNLSSRFMRGWSKNMDTNPFTQFANGLKEMYPQAQAGYDAINALARCWRGCFIYSNNWVIYCNEGRHSSGKNGVQRRRRSRTKSNSATKSTNRNFKKPS